MEHDLDQPTPADAEARLERSVTLDADVDAVWDLVTRPDDLAAWLGREVELDPTPGSEGSVLEHDGTRRRLVVDEVRPGVRITWRWWLHGDGVEPDPSRVEITLTPDLDGTRVDVVEHRLTASATTAGATSTSPGATSACVRAWAGRLLHLELAALLTVTVRV
jgi:uncharacterized protein YndB with AHSA1/START domain